MLTIRKKFLVFTVSEHWYECRYKWYELLGMTAYLHVKNNVPKPPLTVSKPNYTIENNLELTGEQIFEAFTKQYRNQIRQAEKDGVECYFHRDIKGFVPFFNDFARSKGIHQTSERRLEEMGEELLLSYASINGKVVAAHSYHYDRESKVVRTFQSASVRLDEESGLDKNLVGKANKLLHYKDMLHFKNMGVTTYDFGGYAPPEDKRDLKGVNDFKLNFGGEIVTCRNYYTIPYYVCRVLAEKFGLLGQG